MIFALIGILKQPVPPRDATFEAEFNEHLAQPTVRIVVSGYLRDPQGEPVGLMSLIDVESIERAKAFVEASPFHQRNFFERVHIAQYDVEVGRLE